MGAKRAPLEAISNSIFIEKKNAYFLLRSNNNNKIPSGEPTGSAQS